MRIAILHLDLGLGGGERQTIDEALALKAAGHEVTIFTTYHDRTACFPETIDPKLLGGAIEVYGEWIPRQVFGLFTALMSIFRMFWASLRIIWSNREFDCIFVDQVSMVIPLLRTASQIKKVVFYCHHPDYLLGTHDKNMFVNIYVQIKAYLEQITTASADELLVNSKYTESIVLQSFPMIRRLEYLRPRVVYPAIDTSQFKNVRPYRFDPTDSTKSKSGKKKRSNRRVTFLSINRYERKKSIETAINALAKLYKQLQLLGKSDVNPRNVKLVIAGGYDERVAENREYLNELIDLVKHHGMSYQFLSATTFEPKTSQKYSLERDMDVDAFDDDGTGANDDRQRGRRKSLTEQVIGAVGNAVSSVTGGIEDDSEDSDDAEQDEDDDWYDMDDEMDIAEFDKLKKGGANKKRRESSRKSTIDFLDNKQFEIDPNANVYFITKFPDSQKLELLQESVCVLYTPVNEHFGIVPLEAMLAGRPVIACDSGGPLETVANNETGFLCNPTDEAFAHAMKAFIDDKELSAKMGKAGRKTVLKKFSRGALIKVMDDITKEVSGKNFEMPTLLQYQSWAVLALLYLSFVTCAPALFVMSRL